MKKIVAIGIVFLFVGSMGVIGYDIRPSYGALVLEDANNKTCPVTGQTITEKKYNTGYNGKRYWFASFDAVVEFKKNPSQYIKKSTGATSSTAKRTTAASTYKGW